MKPSNLNAPAFKRNWKSAMADILSPSPWSDRQDSIRQNPPTSYAALQAQLAEAKEDAKEEFRESVRFMCKMMDANVVRDAYLAMCAELCEALKPLDRFANMLDRQPIQGNGGILYALHMGTEDQALLREVDCRSASAALAKARKLLEGGE
jgi:hypothetical protein